MTFHRRILAPAKLSESEVSEMYQLLATHYDCVTAEQFHADLAEKTHIILLIDETNTIRGFSTQMLYRMDYQGESIQILFSGDTIVDPSAWGSQELVRGWCDVASEAFRDHGESKLYWFLISKGYRTFLYLPLFFKTYFPQPGTTENDLKPLLDHIAAAKFGEYYDAASGLIQLPQSQGQLNHDLSGIPPGRQEDALVHYFLAKNPHYATGVELACLALVAPENTHGLGRRIFLQAIQQPQ